MISETFQNVARPALRYGGNKLPASLKWRLMTLFRINVPDPGDPQFRETGQRHVRKMLTHIQDDYRPEFDISESTTLDIGCGPGRMLVPVAEKGADAHGVDISPTNLKRCRQYAENRGVSVTLDTADEEIPFDTSFDFIYSRTVFMHLPRRQMVSYLQKAYQNLTQGGLVCFSYRDLEDEQSIHDFFGSLNKRYSFRVRYHTASEVQTYLTAIGYDDVVMKKYTNDDEDYHGRLLAFATKTAENN